ncbi:MAG: hypothetical protein HKN23_17990 [Verrucomicrobiales bacterium]|nr:hypothetical protein [Verrucomicrobiales bacterium]
MKPLTRIRCAVVFIIFGLVVSGATAFPLVWELEGAASIVAADGNLDPAAADNGLEHWILKVREGLVETGEKYPFLAYGTDWLAFGHFIIALFFVPVYRDPVRYIGNLWVGLAACVLVIPLALICGPIRGIPVSWQLIDCSFGVVCFFPMWLVIRWTKQIE